jgi:preprotein translocase subunit SecG
MAFLTSGKVLAFAVGASILCVVGAWLWAVPAVMSRMTFALLAVFAIGSVTVSFMTWRNAQATGTVGQLLHATEVAASSKGPSSD